MLKKLSKKAINIVYCLFCFLTLCVGEQVTHYKEKNVTLALQPETTLAQKADDAWNAEKGKEPVFIAEAVFEFEKTENALEKVSRIMRSFSTMQGITYYSNLKKKTQVLYPKCYTVADATSKTAIPDNTSGSADGKTLYFFQEDNSFGSSVYEATYTETENEIMLQMKNIQALSFSFIKAVKPENLYMTLVVSEQYDTMKLYILVQADVVSFPLIDSYVVKSFNSRLDSISEWFMGEYEK